VTCTTPPPQGVEDVWWYASSSCTVRTKPVCCALTSVPCLSRRTNHQFCCTVYNDTYIGRPAALRRLATFNWASPSDALETSSYVMPAIYMFSQPNLTVGHSMHSSVYTSTVYARLATVRVCDTECLMYWMRSTAVSSPSDAVHNRKISVRLSVRLSVTLQWFGETSTLFRPVTLQCE